VYHYRDSQGGDFYLDPDPPAQAPPGGELPLLRFLRRRGAALDLWSDTGADGQAAPWLLLGDAGLDWRVEPRKVLTTVGDDRMLVPVRGYRALVRPDSSTVMSVVTSAYRVAENESVAWAAVALGRRFDPGARLVAAAGFGRSDERALFVVRLRAVGATTLLLLAHNTHGGEGAVRFQLVEADREVSAILAPDSRHATMSVPHVGDMDERLQRVGLVNMVEEYVAEVRVVWERLRAALWTPRHTRSLLHELWGEPPPVAPSVPGEPLREPSERALRHPGLHLTSVLADCVDPAEVYRLICAYLDNASEACERGDFTRDRDERLALGAGLRLKQRAWRWMVANT
jgi:hypothetical protein